MVVFVVSDVERCNVFGEVVGVKIDERGKKYATNFPADWRLEVEAATFGSKMPHKLIASALKLRAGTANARRNFEKTKPKVVAGFGGYPSYPSLSAARAMGVPIVIHEQNSDDAQFLVHGSGS